MTQTRRRAIAVEQGASRVAVSQQGRCLVPTDSSDHAPSDAPLVMKVSGDLDIAGADSLRREAVAVLDRVPEKGLTIDLTDVPFADARGVSSLLAVRRLVGRRPIRLRGIQPEVQHTLDVLGLDHIFPVEPTSRPDAAPSPGRRSGRWAARRRVRRRRFVGDLLGSDGDGGRRDAEPPR